MSNRRFWDELRSITQLDTDLDVPDSSLGAAVSIFKDSTRKSRVFREIVRNSAAVRSTGLASILHYELANGHSLDLEITTGTHGYRVEGHSNTLLASQVFMFLDEKEYITWMNCGRFEVDNLEPGNYRILFSEEAGNYWIQEFKIGEAT